MTTFNPNSIMYKLLCVFALVLMLGISVLTRTHKKQANAKQCILIGTQKGWHFPHYEITSDTLVADSLFKTYTANAAQSWAQMARDSFILRQTPNSRFYAEYGTYTTLQNGKKHFSGASHRKYFKHRYTVKQP